VSDPLRRAVTNETMLRQQEIINREFLKVDPQMPAQVIATFLYIAAHNPCHKGAIEEDLEMTTASVSRNTDWLGKRHRIGKPGLNLIIKYYDTYPNARRVLLKLSPAGEELVVRIQNHLTSTNNGDNQT